MQTRQLVIEGGRAVLTMLLAGLVGPAWVLPGCTEGDADGDGVTADPDGDQATADPEDCDGGDPATSPGAEEVCDGRDNDCDGEIDEELTTSDWYPDGDGDGYGSGSEPAALCGEPAGYAGAGGDCDDGDARVYPGALEVCDGGDNDCDGAVDEDLYRTWYRDQDGDGYGDEADTVVSDCPVPAGYVGARGDCNDQDADVHPGAADGTGDGEDGDCGGGDGPQPWVGLGTGGASSIQAALDEAASGETVWVGPGTYEEHGVSFRGKAVRLVSTWGAEATVIDAGQQGRVMTFNSGEDAGTELDGFTLTGGYVLSTESEDGGTGTTDEGEWWGGGVYLYQSSPTLRECVITGNRADGYYYSRGGGVYLEQSNATLTGCRIAENESAAQNIPTSTGGGLYLVDSSPVLTDCIISSNLALGSGPSGGTSAGGGLCIHDSTPVLIGCTISDNQVLASGDWASGGGLSVTGVSATLIDCTIVGNTAGSNGGGIAVGGANISLTSCLLEDNGGPSGENTYGGGVYLWYGSADLTNTLVTGNRSGGVLILISSQLTLIQSIVARNTVYGISLTFYEENFISNNSIISFNDGPNLYYNSSPSSVSRIQYTDLYNPPGQDNYNVTGLDASNLTTEPGFLAYDAGGLPSDFHLASSSGLIDAGDPTVSDPDGSRADLGIYGGPDGGSWDLDRDGYPDYFWPGTIQDAPPGFDPGMYDQDDSDPDNQ